MTESANSQEPEFDPELEQELRKIEQEIEAEVAAEAEPASSLDEQLAVLTSDLQRVQAEYSNYRKRVERDRALARDGAIGDVLVALLPVLDDFARAEQHGELVGAFKSVNDAVLGVMNRFGLEPFGEVGEEFDPAVHEALTHQGAEAAGDFTTVVTAVYQPGYRHAGRVLRPARVAVADQTK